MTPDKPSIRPVLCGRAVIIAILAMAIAFVARADAPDPMPWSPEHERVLGAGDAESGRALTSKCDRCHGENGVSVDPEMPHLAGQNAKYLYKQLQDFKSEARIDSGMNRRARKLSDKDMADLAAWYSSLELPPMLAERALDAPALVVDGDPSRGIPACQACHGVEGRGMSRDYDAPSLAGMPYAYFVSTMQAFKDATRSNDAGAVVRQFAGQINDDEVKSLAAYYLALGRRQRAPLE